MNDQDLDKTLNQDDFEEVEPTILRNEIGKAVDPTVVIDESDRTVVLTPDEAFIIEKEHLIDIPPKNRPRKVYGGMWGPVEIGTAGAAMVAVFAAVLVYIFVVAPSNREVENNRVRLAALENELVSARSKYGNISSTKSQVEVVLSSVSDFESRYLPSATNGRTALYQRINGLIASYGLINTTGPDYSPLEIVDQNEGNQTEEERGKSKFKSLFPGVYVSTTVEGPYVNLRRFLREIETGSEFIIVSAVDLEPSESEEKRIRERATQAGIPGGPNPTLGDGFSESNTRMQMQPASQAVVPNSQRGRTHGSVVRLRLEMAAYFRRPNLTPVEPEAVTP